MALVVLYKFAELMHVGLSVVLGLRIDLVMRHVDFGFSAQINVFHVLCFFLTVLDVLAIFEFVLRKVSNKVVPFVGAP